MAQDALTGVYKRQKDARESHYCNDPAGLADNMLPSQECEAAMLKQDALDAIDHEIEATARPVRAKIAKVQIVGKLVEIYLKDDTEGIDESIEEAMAWWGPGQQASVLAIHAEEHKVTLRHLVGAPPFVDTQVAFYKPKYLKKPYEIWQHNGRSAEALKVFTALQTPQVRSPARRSALFPKLREKQHEALGLKNQHIGFLWGRRALGRPIR